MASDHRRRRHDACPRDRQGDRGQASRTIPIGSRSSTASTTCIAGSRARSRTSRWSSTTTTASTSFSTSCRPSRSARRTNTATRTKAGAFRYRARFAGDPALSWHLINALVADEFDITMCQEMLVDHAVTIPHGADVAGPDVAGEDRAGVDQHRAASAAVAGALPQARPLDRPRARILSARSAGADRGHRRAVASARRQAGRLHQQGLRSALPRQDRQRSRGAHALLDPRSGSSSPARRAWSSSTGWRCAAR